MTTVGAAPVSTEVAERPPPSGTVRGGGFRADIQGLRAVAVLLVLGYHAGLPFLPGGFVGVDVFFVISGFLITGLILREVDRTGRLSLGRFWARRARRLLPATAVVLAAVAALTLAFLPVTRWPSIGWDLLTSSLYVVNWRLAEESVDYLAADAAPSPVQHFWSLAVEEQFYVIWPVLILVLVWLHRRSGWSLRRTLTGGIMLLAVPSFVWGVHLAAVDPGRSYFVSTTRVWELAVGALLALVGHRMARLPVVAAHLIGWIGAAAIVVAALRFDAATPFPGYAALAPTLGAAAVLAAGTAYSGRGVGRLLSVPPMRDIGTLSYSLYLWHWPLLVAATAAWGREDGTLWTPVGVMVVGASVVPAWLTYRVVEAPLHHARMFARFPWRAAVLGVVCTAVGAAAAVVVYASVPAADTASPAEAPGAAVLGDDPASDPDAEPVDSVEVMVPDVLSAGDDEPTLDGENCILDTFEDTLHVCEYGPADAEVTVAVVGDSKMDQWIPAIEKIADERGWRLLTYLKDACPLAQVDIARDGGVYESCGGYNAERLAALHDDPSIDYVVTSQRTWYAFDDGASLPERTTMLVDDLRDTWAQLEDSGKDVIVLRDNPSPTLDVRECVATDDDHLSACAFSRADGEADSGGVAQLLAVEQSPEVDLVDLNDYICPGEQCPAVIGNVLLYRQGTHLTTAYVESLTPRLDEALARAMVAP